MTMGNSQQGGAYGGGGVQGGYGSGGGQLGGGGANSGGALGGSGGDGDAGGHSGSVTAAVSSSRDDGGYSKSANFAYSRTNDGFSQSAASSNTPSTGEQITAANRAMGISDAMTAHNLALNGYSYGDRVSALTGSVLDAAAPNLGFTGHGLISSALSMVPGVGFVLNAADIGQKAYTNGISSISAKDGAGLIASGLSTAGFSPAALAVNVLSAGNEAINGNPAPSGQMAGGLIGSVLGGLTGNQVVSQVGSRVGSMIGGQVALGGASGGADTSGGKDSSRGGNGGDRTGGSVTAAANAFAKPSVAQQQAAYQQPAMKYLNTSEYM